MTTDDTDALIEKIAHALGKENYVYGPNAQALFRDDAAAVLPIVEAEVCKAKAEALREAADDIDFDLGRGYTGADDRDATAAAEVWLRDRAEQIKKEDPR